MRGKQIAKLVPQFLFVTKHGISLSATYIPRRFPPHLTFPFDSVLGQRRNVGEKLNEKKSKAQAKNEETIFHVYCSAAYRRLSLVTAKQKKTFFLQFPNGHRVLQSWIRDREKQHAAERTLHKAFQDSPAFRFSYVNEFHRHSCLHTSDSMQHLRDRNYFAYFDLHFSFYEVESTVELFVS